MHIEAKRQDEKNIVELMIKIYCRDKHAEQKELCHDCQELLEYTFQRIDKCPFIETKSFCSACETPCYSPEMRNRIKTVMRHSGPRMLLYHPLIATRHFLKNFIKKPTG
jgi:hypothetical protein